MITDKVHSLSRILFHVTYTPGLEKFVSSNLLLLFEMRMTIDEESWPLLTKIEN